MLAIISSMSLRTLDLFSGAGGSSWGAKGAGADIVCGVDGWDIAARTYESNFGPCKGRHLMLDDDAGPELLGNLGRINLLLASPECTNHTCAKGARTRSEASKKTANYVLNFAADLKPRWIVLENVIQMRNWHGYDPLIEKLENLGYGVTPQLLNAQDFGVPQSRRRLFLLCEKGKKPGLVPIPKRIVKTVQSIIDWDGGWQSTPLDNGKRAEATLARAATGIANVGRQPFLIVYYGSDGSGGWQPLDRPLRTLTTLDRFGLVTWKGRTPMLRMLQVPELKRAMGFSDAFQLDHGVRRDRIKLLGNGVCPPVMKAIVKSLIG